MELDEFDDLPLTEGTQKKKGRRGCLVALIVLLSLLLAGLLAIAMIGNYYLGRLNRFENPVPNASEPKMSDEFDTETQPGIETLETVDASDVTFPTVEVLEGDMINIMLIGQDRRPGEERSRSDSMILVTLNKQKNTIQLTSFMRDLYVQIPGYLDNRLNVAYRYGDVPLMNETFRVNFGLEIDGNVMVDFETFQDIIDILGGVDVYVTGNEAMAMRMSGFDGIYEGMNHLNSEEAMYFSRLRWIDSDYNRTQRQRKVLLGIADSLKNSDVITMLDLIDQVLPCIVTNLSNAQIVEYATIGLGMMADGVEIQTMRIPANDAHYDASIRGMAVLVPDLEMCREDLEEFIYLVDVPVPTAETEQP